MIEVIADSGFGLQCASGGHPPQSQICAAQHHFATVAFAARAAVDDTTGTEYTAVWARVRSGLHLLIAAATGRAETAVDDSTELLALLDGLTLAVIAEHGNVDPATARRIAQRHIASLVAH